VTFQAVEQRDIMLLAYLLTPDQSCDPIPEPHKQHAREQTPGDNYNTATHTHNSSASEWQRCLSKSVRARFAANYSMG